MRSSDAAFFPAIKISFTDTRKTPASRKSSCVKPLTANDRMNNPTVSRITTLVHGSLDLNSFMAIAPSDQTTLCSNRALLKIEGPLPDSHLSVATRYQHRISRRQIESCNFGIDRHILKLRLLPRLRVEAQQILVVEDVLQLVEIGHETHRLLQSQKERFATGSIRQLRNAHLSVGGYPVVPSQAAHTRRIDRMN